MALQPLEAVTDLIETHAVRRLLAKGPFYNFLQQSSEVPLEREILRTANAEDPSMLLRQVHSEGIQPFRLGVARDACDDRQLSRLDRVELIQDAPAGGEATGETVEIQVHDIGGDLSHFKDTL